MNQIRKAKKFHGVKQPVPLTRRRRNFKFKEHECTIDCSGLEQAIISENADKFKVTESSVLMYDQSPFLVPLYFEYKRGIANNHAFGYLSPCGVELFSLDDVYRYLKKTGSKLNVNQFTFTARIELYREHDAFKVYAFRKDISFGKEPIPVQFINEHDSKFYEPFNYINEINFKLDEQYVKNLFKEDLKCCTCEDDCSNADTCACRQASILENKNLNLNKTGYHFNYLVDPVESVIYECNSKCSCKVNCLNRVVQNGIKVRMQVYKTNKRGFGVRVLHDVPKGTFICSYVGDVILNKRTSEEYSNPYLMNLNYQYYMKLVKNEPVLNDKSADNDESKSELEPEKKNEDAKLDEESIESNSKKNSVEEEFSLVRTDEINAPDTDFSDSSSESSSFSDLTYNSDKSDLFDSELEDEDKDSNEKNKSTDQNTSKDSKEIDEANDSEFLVDARENGNVSRFFNHSCNPNMIAQPIFTKLQNPIFTEFSFFSSKDIKAFSELTFNYFVGNEAGREEFRCYCRSKKCISRKIR